MTFSRDQHDRYGKISGVCICALSHMFILEVKVQYTINLNIRYSFIQPIEKCWFVCTHNIMLCTCTISIKLVHCVCMTQNDRDHCHYLVRHVNVGHLELIKCVMCGMFLPWIYDFYSEHSGEQHVYIPSWDVGISSLNIPMLTNLWLERYGLSRC